MKLSRMAQDSILYDMSVTQDEIVRLKTKLANEGLSSPEYHTLQMLEEKLRQLRNM